MYVHMYLYMYVSMHASKWNWQKDTHQSFIWGPWLNCHHSSPLQRPGGSGTSVCVGVRCLCLDTLHFNFGRSQSPCSFIGYQLAGYMWLVCCLSATQCYKNPSSLKPQNDPSLVWYYLQLGCFQVCPLCWGRVTVSSLVLLELQWEHLLLYSQRQPWWSWGSKSMMMVAVNGCSGEETSNKCSWLYCCNKTQLSKDLLTKTYEQCSFTYLHLESI